MRQVVVILLLMFAAVASAQQPSVDQSVLWAHGSDPDSGDILWMNFDKSDASATDTANGPGYTCPIPSLPDDLNILVCQVERVDGPGILTAPAEDEYTFTIEMDPVLAADFYLDVVGTVSFEVFLGSSSGEGSGTFDSKIINGETVVAEVTGVAWEYSSAYVGFTAETTPLVDTVLADGGLTWEIHVSGSWNGMFMGIHPDNGKSNVALPIIAELPTAEPESNETMDQNATGNATEDNTTDGNATEAPEPSEGPEPTEPAETVEEPEETAEVAVAQSVDDESSGIPAPGALVFLAAVGGALWVARRRS